jgi:hypothetical protein
MKKFMLALMAATLSLSACTQPLVTPQKTYPAYGLFNADSNYSEKVCYEASTGSVVLGVILIETVIAPVYFFGFDLYQPVRLKGENGGCGIDAK